MITQSYCIRKTALSIENQAIWKPSSRTTGQGKNKPFGRLSGFFALMNLNVPQIKKSQKVSKSACDFAVLTGYPLRGQVLRISSRNFGTWTPGTLKTEYAVIRKSWRQDHVTVWDSLCSGAPRSPVRGGAIYPTGNAESLSVWR